MTTQTSDKNAVKLYEFTLFVKYSGTPYTTAGTFDFAIDVIDPCLNDATLTP